MTRLGRGCASEKNSVACERSQLVFCGDVVHATEKHKRRGLVVAKPSKTERKGGERGQRIVQVQQEGALPRDERTRVHLGNEKKKGK